mmetsp:Transcript_9047/g.20428  ORF Transcript_9047/g.20428 Transcript_9047/m.20428 type:complete len:203 (+) Transcript_9047:774-1382(+)
MIPRIAIEIMFLLHPLHFVHEHICLRTQHFLHIHFRNLGIIGKVPILPLPNIRKVMSTIARSATMDQSRHKRVRRGLPPVRPRHVLPNLQPQWKMHLFGQSRQSTVVIVRESFVVNDQHGRGRGQPQPLGHDAFDLAAGARDHVIMTQRLVLGELFERPLQGVDGFIGNVQAEVHVPISRERRLTARLARDGTFEQSVEEGG